MKNKKQPNETIHAANAGQASVYAGLGFPVSFPNTWGSEWTGGEPLNAEEAVKRLAGFEAYRIDAIRDDEDKPPVLT